MQRLVITTSASSTPRAVWSVLADTKSWNQWAPFDQITVERGSGEGEIRSVRSGRIVTRERVLEFVPPRRYAYEIVSGLPIRDHHAEIALEGQDSGGTKISWRTEFRATVPGTGWAIRLLLRNAIRKAADALAQHADGVT